MMKYLSLLQLLVSTTTAFVPLLHTSTSQRQRPTAFALHAKKDKETKQSSSTFDMDELNRRISYAHLWFTPPSPTEVLPDDFFILWVQPGTPQQGVHTIEFPVGSGSNILLAFEDEEECELFAEQLLEQNFIDPTPQKISLERLDAFCQQLGIFAQYVPEGVHLIPPRQNVKEFGLKDPNLRSNQEHLEYLFAMEETDIESEGTMEAMGSWE